MLAAGFTLAPLKAADDVEWRGGGGDGGGSPGFHGADSPECLVTLVLSVDFGGLLSRRSWLWPIVGEALSMPWLENLLMTVVALRDKVRGHEFMCDHSTTGEQG